LEWLPATAFPHGWLGDRMKKAKPEGIVRPDPPPPPPRYLSVSLPRGPGPYEWVQATPGRAKAITGAGPADEQALVMPNGTPVYAEDVRALAMASMDLANQVSCLWDENGTFDPYVGDFDGMAAQDAMEEILGFGPPLLNPAPEAAK